MGVQRGNGECARDKSECDTWASVQGQGVRELRVCKGHVCVGGCAREGEASEAGHM